MAMGGFCGGYHFFLGGVRFAVAEVLSYCAGLEPCFLQDHAVHTSHGGTGTILYRLAAYAYLAAVGIIEPHKEVYHCGLAAACWAYDSSTLSALYMEVEVLDKLDIRDIAEGHVVNVHCAVNGSEDCSIRAVRYLLCLIYYLKDTLCGGKSTLQLGYDA